MSEDVTKRLMAAFSQFGRLNRGKKHTSVLKPSDMMLLIKMIEMTRSGEDLSVSALSAALGVSKPFVTKSLNPLAKEGFVERKSHENDRRMVMICVTPKGVDKIEKAQRQFTAAIDGLVKQIGEERSLLLAELLGESYIYLENFHQQLE